MRTSSTKFREVIEAFAILPAAFTNLIVLSLPPEDFGAVDLFTFDCPRLTGFTSSSYDFIKR